MTSCSSNGRPVSHDTGAMTSVWDQKGLGAVWGDDYVFCPPSW